MKRADWILLVVGILAFAAILVWYGWKLLVCLMLWGWMMNLENKMKKK